MSLLRLTVIIFVLSTAIGLTLWNPTMDDYLRFVEQELARALDKMDQNTPSKEQQMIRQIFSARSKQLVESNIRPRTTRLNCGLFSQFRTHVLDTEVLVIGIAGRFIPIKGVEETTLKIGRMAF